MKRGLLAGAALAALTSAALAADLRTPVKAPPIVAAPVSAAYDWSGFYVGGNYGTVIAQWRAHTGAANDHLGDVEVNDAGLTAGAQAGYNWQFDPNWLVGVEGDIGYLGTNRRFKDWNDATIVGIKTTWYGTMRVRAGYVMGASLLYATGGAAFVHIDDAFGGNSFTGAPGPATNTSIKAGWAAGGGIETKLSRSWSTTTEYLYVDAGSTIFASNPFGTLSDTTTVDHRFHVIKSGLNYRFGGPSEGLPFLPFSNTPLLTPAHNWAGFYVGGNVGAGISVARAVATPNTPADATGETDINGTGFTGGGQAGYNLMIIPKWFVGVEGDINYLGIDHSFVEWNDSDTFALKTDWYSTLRGRVGSTTGPAFLYLTGGAAFVHVRDTPTQGTLATSVSKTASGWVFGGGVETALDAHWSARLESLYLDVGSEHASALNGISTQFKNRFQVIRAGLDYTFGGSDLLPFR
jgi:outer membrane immunogenic protein